RAALSVDKSLPDQLLIYLGLSGGSRGLAQGDLGSSWDSGDLIARDLRRVVPITLELITYSFIVACIVAVPLGIVAALRVNGRLDRLVSSYGLFAGAQPDFWWGLTF